MATLMIYRAHNLIHEAMIDVPKSTWKEHTNQKQSCVACPSTLFRLPIILRCKRPLFQCKATGVPHTHRLLSDLLRQSPVRFCKFCNSFHRENLLSKPHSLADQKADIRMTCSCIKFDQIHPRNGSYPTTKPMPTCPLSFRRRRERNIDTSPSPLSHEMRDRLMGA